MRSVNEQQQKNVDTYTDRIKALKTVRAFAYVAPHLTVSRSTIQEVDSMKAKFATKLQDFASLRQKLEQ